MFVVRIKPETFEVNNMGFLSSKGFKPETDYLVIGIMKSDKLLIADKSSGEMIELYPRNCSYISYDRNK